MSGFWYGSGISWTTCKKSAPRSRQTTTPTPYHSIFYRLDALPDAQWCQRTEGTLKFRTSGKIF